MASRQQRFVERIYRSARNIGLPDVQARVAAAQAALETGYGKSVKGNNFFGIKAGSSWRGKTQSFRTWEEVGGKRVNITDQFRAYDTPEDSLRDWVALMDRRYPAVLTAQTFEEAAAGLRYGRRGGYATDSQYGAKLAYIQRQFMGGLEPGESGPMLASKSNRLSVAEVAPGQIPLPVPRPGVAYAAEPQAGVLPQQTLERMGQGGTLPVPVPRPLPDAQFDQRSNPLPRAPMPSMREPAYPRAPIPVAGVPVPQTRPRPYQDGTKFHVSKRPDEDERDYAHSVMDRLERQEQELREQARQAEGDERKRLHMAAATKSAERRTLDEYYNPPMPDMREPTNPPRAPLPRAPMPRQMNEPANPPRPRPPRDMREPANPPRAPLPRAPSPRQMNEPVNPRPPISVASVPTPRPRPQPLQPMREPANPSRERLPVPTPRPPVAAPNIPVPQGRPRTYAYNPPVPSSSRPMPRVPVPQNRPYPLPAERPRSYATNLPVPSVQRPMPRVPVPTPAPRSYPTPQARPSTYAMNPPAPVPNRPPINSGGYAVTPPVDPIATSATTLPRAPYAHMASLPAYAKDPTADAMASNRSRGMGDATLEPLETPAAPKPRPPMTGPITMAQPKTELPKTELPRAPAPERSSAPQPRAPTEISWKVPTGMDFWQGKSDYGLDTSGGTLWRDTKTGRQYRYSPQADQVMRVDNGRSIPVFGGSGITGKGRGDLGDLAITTAAAMAGAALGGMPGAIVGREVGRRVNNSRRNARNSEPTNRYPAAPKPASGSSGASKSSVSSAGRSRSPSVADAIESGQGGLW